MAGRLPGVGVPPRKREQNHHHLAFKSSCRDSHRREPVSEPWITVSAMDETALKARQRLQQKLAHFYSSSCGSSYIGRNEGKVSQSSIRKKVGAGLGGKLWGRSWILRLNRSYKKERKVCAICLEDFQQQQEQQLMKLSCSHKYHSACLLPWLAAHPNCPYCRTPVKSDRALLFHHC